MRQHPVWEFCNDDELGELMMSPVKTLPISDAGNRLISGEFRLADGSGIFGYLGNLSLTKPETNPHFLILSLFVGKKVQDLARYHDFNFSTRGPSWLAKQLGKKKEDVFPISYDLSNVAAGKPNCVRGVILEEPLEKLSRNQIIQMAVG